MGWLIAAIVAHMTVVQVEPWRESRDEAARMWKPQRAIVDIKLRLPFAGEKERLHLSHTYIL